MKKIAIIGYGARGHIYANYIKSSKDLKIIAVIDNDETKLNKARRDYKDIETFNNIDMFISLPKKADAVLVCSPDSDHFYHSKLCLEAGFDLLLEKPISNSFDECLRLNEIAKLNDKSVIVSHVLRYTVFYQKIKEIIESGEIGRVVHIHQSEDVGYWHYAHSFVRGNWRNDNTSAPMILAKCCHDTDIISWLIGKNCLSVSSIGNLMHFKKESAPQGAAKRCTECKIADSCCYNAVKFYINNKDWMPLIFEENATDEIIEESLKTSPYGICVFHCDNNVVDHQVVNMQYEDDITASLTMIAFSEDVNRKIHIYGTYGEITADFNDKKIQVNIFQKRKYTIDITELTNDFSNHGGGDNRLMDDFVKVLNGKSNECIGISAIENSIQSHLIAFAAEKSRLSNGMPVRLSSYE